MEKIYKLFNLASVAIRMIEKTGAVKSGKLITSKEIKFDDTNEFFSMIDDLIKIQVLVRVSNNTAGQDEVYVKGILF